MPPSEAPTEYLPPATGAGGYRAEPALLTHREPDGYDDYDEDAVYDDDGPDSPLTAEEEKRRRRKKIWRRVRRTMYVLMFLGIVGPIVAFFIAYQMVEIETPEALASQQMQSVTLKYNDGTSDLTRIDPEGGKRTLVKLNQVPTHVQNAVLAAEDSTFWENPGFDFTGILGAAWNQVTGGTGGGSTITQQYIKKATENEDKTFTRKALEVVKAYKMNNQWTKQDTLQAYLNTIYFGRGAYGIEAAAQAYFKKPVGQLTVAEGAFIAGIIQLPNKWSNDQYTDRRWKYVMDQMVANGKLNQADRAAAQKPVPVPQQKVQSAQLGPREYIKDQVQKELESTETTNGRSLWDEVQKRGLIVHTSIDKQGQDIAEKTVREAMADQPKNLIPALVAIDPKTGEVRAYYGGEGSGLDWAGHDRALQEPGSSFKPFDLVALLRKDKGLGESYDGSSPRKFGAATVTNSGGKDCNNPCTVARAMEESVNTVFFDIALNIVGTPAVAKAAHDSGIPTTIGNAKTLVNDKGGAPDGNISIGGGNTRVRTIDMAAAYATFADDGMRHTPHFVTKVTYPDGSLYHETSKAPQRAYDQDEEKNKKIARNVTESLIKVIPYSKLNCGGRPCAGKTGTHEFYGSDNKSEENSKAWMVGYTPYVSSAVSLAAVGPDGKPQPLKDKKGKDIYGKDLPGEIWQKFLTEYSNVRNFPKTNFSKFEPIGKAASDETSSSVSRPSNSTTQPPPTQTTLPPTTQPTTVPTTEPTPGRPTSTSKPPRPTWPTLPGGGPSGDARRENEGRSP
ncbi:membrane peptidoglycan carboxypeptidase [Herbihabitans rhizosphaerae]|uniref:Membrane peptidoglycan carboxypeptidase n=2 Tax=Herbihabitans rhizosphaerae TaxID=1872711 RepID=A0A4Q7KN06_9PSEU|nr:membrane peptidoglycan carboxypeptidase [Herbihabitans rhizosphaerae]